eukprot:3052542-Prymnesium_polylepis.1
MLSIPSTGQRPIPCAERRASLYRVPVRPHHPTHETSDSHTRAASNRLARFQPNATAPHPTSQRHTQRHTGSPRHHTGSKQVRVAEQRCAAAERLHKMTMESEAAQRERAEKAEKKLAQAETPSCRNGCKAPKRDQPPIGKGHHEASEALYGFSP